MAEDVLKQRWVVINGSIACERVYQQKADLGGKYETRDWIAFNVGDKAAQHIVKLHNQLIGERNGQHL